MKHLKIFEEFNNIPEDIKKEIDNMDYATMLRKWRFEPSSSYLFAGKIGDYFRNSMEEKKKNIENPSAISKSIGWN